MLYKKLTLEAEAKNLCKVMDSVEKDLESINCNNADKNAICLCLEEIFINVANYAYPEGVGLVTVEYTINEEVKQAQMIFTDEGIEYNPLNEKDPNVNLSTEKREIGGLGIYLCKKFMDKIEYSYEDNKNILKMQRKLTL